MLKYDLEDQTKSKDQEIIDEKLASNAIKVENAHDTYMEREKAEKAQRELEKENELSDFDNLKHGLEIIIEDEEEEFDMPNIQTDKIAEIDNG